MITLPLMRVSWNRGAMLLHDEKAATDDVPAIAEAMIDMEKLTNFIFTNLYSNNCQMDSVVVRTG